MEIITKEYTQIKGDYNNEKVYEKFNELTGLNFEFELDDQSWGTDCYGLSKFNEKEYPTLEKLKIQIEDHKSGKEKISNWDIDLVFNYLRRKGILPEIDILFEISY